MLDSPDCEIIETPEKTSRKRRNSVHGSNCEAPLAALEVESCGGKRIKLHRKRTPDLKLRNRKRTEVGSGDGRSMKSLMSIKIKKVDRLLREKDEKLNSKRKKRQKKEEIIKFNEAKPDTEEYRQCTS